MIGRDDGPASERSQPDAGCAAQAGTPAMTTSTRGAPKPAFCSEAIAASSSRIPPNGPHGGVPRAQPSVAMPRSAGLDGSGWSWFQ